MAELSSDDGQNLRPREGQDRKTVIGDADNVESTTYVTGRGTTPEQRKGEGPIATVPSRGAGGLVAVVVVLVLLMALVYFLAVA